jgi:hypothetical protein
LKSALAPQSDTLPAASRTAQKDRTQEKDLLLRTVQFVARVVGVFIGFFVGAAFAYPLGHSLPQDIFGLEFLIFLEGKSGAMTMAVLCAFAFSFLFPAVLTRIYKRYERYAVALTVATILFGVGVLLMFLAG